MGKEIMTNEQVEKPVEEEVRVYNLEYNSCTAEEKDAITAFCRKNIESKKNPTPLRIAEVTFEEAQKIIDFVSIPLNLGNKEYTLTLIE